MHKITQLSELDITKEGIEEELEENWKNKKYGVETMTTDCQ